MKTQKELVQYLVTNGTLITPHIISAFENIDRRDFMGDIDDDTEVYVDHPVPIGYGQTISQPSTVAFMMELLRPERSENILDVGSGSGWTTALLAQIVGDTGTVHGVEIVSELARFGADNLAKYHFVNASIEKAGEIYGLSEHAPYDKILVSAAGKNIPEQLIDQLKIGGVIVIPVNNEVIRYIKTTKTEGETEHFWGFSFVPLIPNN